MKVITSYIELETQGKFDIVDITGLVQENLSSSLLEEGSVTIFNIGSTAGITTVEYEDGLIKDIKDCFEKLIPSDQRYEHDDRWHDGNGYSHIRSTLMKTSLSVPFVKSQLILGTWQQIIFIEFDDKPRRRKIVTQYIGV